MIVVSAFYDTEFLNRLVGGVPESRRRSVELVVYLHGFSGSRLKNDLVRLKAWRRVQKLKSVQVLLITRGSLFHSKLLVFETATATTVLIGSANATTAAYSENEEIMLCLGDKGVRDSVRDYLSSLALDARTLDDVKEPETRSLIAFFRTGDIYYKPNALPLFRFDLRLPEKLRQELSRLTEDIPGFSAKTSRTYNPFAALVEDEVEEVGDGESSRISIRPYAAQTCFGWWAPRQYHSIIDGAVVKASVRKRERLLTIRMRFTEELESGSIFTQAKRSFELLIKVANEHGTPLEESQQERLKRFSEFLERCRKQLGNKRWFERATRAYDHSPMPEIWADPVARGEFEESFFDYLQYVNAASTAPLILTSIAKAIRLDATDGAGEIRAKLIRCLHDVGWSGDEWRSSVRRASRWKHGDIVRALYDGKPHEPARVLRLDGRQQAVVHWYDDTYSSVRIGDILGASDKPWKLPLADADVDLSTMRSIE